MLSTRDNIFSTWTEAEPAASVTPCLHPFGTRQLGNLHALAERCAR